RVSDAHEPNRRESDGAVEICVERIGESPAGLHFREEHSVKTRYFVSTCVLIASALVATPLVAQGGATGTAASIPKLRFEKSTLPNGLQVILHEDHSTPIVVANTWYHVGSGDEQPGRTGFAH